MVQLHVLTGKRAGTIAVGRRFPWRIGRSADADLRLEDEGVWERHGAITLRQPEGLQLSLHPDARAVVNGRVVQETILHNGDVIELGAVKLRFWLSEVRQASLRPREWFTWLLLAAGSMGQVALIYWLQR